MRFYITYGSWSVAAAIHAFTEEGKKLCDGKTNRYGTELGYAGGVSSVTCARCKKKIEKLKAQGIEVIDIFEEE